MTDHQVTQYDLIAICAVCYQQVKILKGGVVVVHMPVSERTVQISPCGCPTPGREPAYWYCSVHRRGSSYKGLPVTGEADGGQFIIGAIGTGKRARTDDQR